jgi:rubrerythrin
MTETQENLATAFSGESQADRKYLAFAKQADREGFPQIARLFRAASAAETVHALNHLRIMGGVKSTSENLQEAIESETFEFTKMYPEYLEVAGEEGERQASWSFNVANQVEKIHAGLYNAAAEAVKNGKDLKQVDYYVCQVCGNTVENEPPERCPICNAPEKSFLKIE